MNDRSSSIPPASKHAACNGRRHEFHPLLPTCSCTTHLYRPEIDVERHPPNHIQGGPHQQVVHIEGCAQQRQARSGRHGWRRQQQLTGSDLPPTPPPVPGPMRCSWSSSSRHTPWMWRNPLLRWESRAGWMVPPHLPPPCPSTPLLHQHNHTHLPRQQREMGCPCSSAAAAQQP